MAGRGAGGAAPRGTESFGACLRELREAAGLSQEELALKANLSPNAVGALEQGRRKRPYPHTVRSLAEALGLPEGERKSLLAAVPGRGETAAPDAPPVTEAAPSGALPHPVTALVGRERELGEVGGLISRPDVRLLTLTGVGGVGKSRLALEATRKAAGDFLDGAAFVGLAPLADPALVLPTVVRTLGLREGEGRNPGDVLRAYLGEKDFLLVLDNLEHLLGAATEVAGLVEACPGLVVLATSRAPLRIRGECEYPVPPLALPPSTRSPAGEDVTASPAGRLFAERARAVYPGFEISRGNASSVAAICWRLAGLPLALELAAAKVRHLDPRTLLSRLDGALSSAGARDLPERQRTMRATLDWSHALLSEPEQRLLRRLSVFAGGFTLSAAEAVGAHEGDADGEEEVLEKLGGLVEQSLVEAEPDPEGCGVRYGMLEPVRQYAREKLIESGEAEKGRRRHARYCLALAEAAEPELRGPRQAEWLDRLEAEHGNIRAALRWCFGGGEARLGADLAGASWLFWYYRDHLEEGREWLKAAACAVDPATSTRARALLLDRAAVMALVQTRYGEAKALLEEGLSLFRELEDDEGVASCLAHLGLAAAVGGQDRASMPHLLEELTALRPKLADERTTAEVLAFCGMVASGLGEAGRGEAMLEEGLALYRETRDARGACLCLTTLGFLALTRGDDDRGHALLAENLRLARRSKDRLALHYSLLGLAEVALLRHQPVRAAHLWGAAEGMRETHDLRLSTPAGSSLAYEDRLGAARVELGDAAFGAAWARGKAMTEEEAADYALGRDAPHRPDAR